MHSISLRKGFTLIEILIVIGILAILVTIVTLTLDPAARFRNANESRRLSDIQALSNAINQYAIDSKGVYPAGIDERERQIGTATEGCAILTNHCHVEGEHDCVDLSEALKTYIQSVPTDPNQGSVSFTRYSVQKEVGGNRIIVRACDSNEDYMVQ